MSITEICFSFLYSKNTVILQHGDIMFVVIRDVIDKENAVFTNPFVLLVLYFIPQCTGWPEVTTHVQYFHKLSCLNKPSFLKMSVNEHNSVLQFRETAI